TATLSVDLLFGTYYSSSSLDDDLNNGMLGTIEVTSPPQTTTTTTTTVATTTTVTTPTTTPRPRVTSVTVTMGKPSEFHFLLSKTSVPHGTVGFKLVNKGKLAHDFSISGKASKPIGPGKSGTLTVMLTKGKKPYKCTIDGHAAAGMKGMLRVA